MGTAARQWRRAERVAPPASAVHSDRAGRGAESEPGFHLQGGEPRARRLSWPDRPLTEKFLSFPLDSELFVSYLTPCTITLCPPPIAQRHRSAPGKDCPCWNLLPSGSRPRSSGSSRAPRCIATPRRVAAPRGHTAWSDVLAARTFSTLPRPAPPRRQPGRFPPGWRSATRVGAPSLHTERRIYRVAAARVSVCAQSLSSTCQPPPRDLYSSTSVASRSKRVRAREFSAGKSCCCACRTSR